METEKSGIGTNSRIELRQKKMGLRQKKMGFEPTVE